MESMLITVEVLLWLVITKASYAGTSKVSLPLPDLKESLEIKRKKGIFSFLAPFT